jgi:protein involved in polysaccharide export with SLBB domain
MTAPFLCREAAEGFAIDGAIPVATVGGRRFAERRFGSKLSPMSSKTLAGDESPVLAGLEYRPGDPVRITIVHREQRTLVTDGGSALERAGSPPHWQALAQQLERELNVNISRHGVISLPVVRVGPPEAEVVRRIGEASRAFYQELLELDPSQGSS